jgi:hypothetical protein
VLALAGPVAVFAVIVLGGCGDGSSDSGPPPSTGQTGTAPPATSDGDDGFLANRRKLSQCMRDNGVPSFPDPNPDGTIPHTWFNDPSMDLGKLQEAYATCQRLLSGG